MEALIKINKYKFIEDKTIDIEDESSYA